MIVEGNRSDVRRFHARILGSDGYPVGTCFQVAEGLLVTAYHVISEAGCTAENPNVRFVSLDGGPVGVASVASQSAENDLAVLRTESKLPAVAVQLAYSESQERNISFELNGFATLDEAIEGGDHGYHTTVGTWEGPTLLPDETKRMVGLANGAAVGMSGCPVLRVSDKAVIGVLSGRYNADHVQRWAEGRVWISRIEDLMPLLEGLGEFALEREPIPEPAQGEWLREMELSRDALLSDECFEIASAWNGIWGQGEAAIRNGDALVLAALPGVGATTFAEQLLARTLPHRTRLVRLDPGDWSTPNAKHLPRRPWCAYILDLRDPEHDVPSREFAREIDALAVWYKSMQSRLIITVASELWRGKDVGNLPNTYTIRLDKAPDSRALVERYVQVHVPDLPPVVREQDVAKHLEGMNAVQAMQRFEKIWQISRSRADSIPDEQGQLKGRIVEELDDHIDELIGLFGDPYLAHDRNGTPRHTEHAPLTLEDRCLLLAVSHRRSGRLTEIEGDSAKLLDALRYGADSKSVVVQEPDVVLAGPGLRGRLKRINASIGPNEFISLDRPSFGDAVVRYVWDNYAKVRQPLARWLLGLVAEDAANEGLVQEWLASLVCRHQNVDFIKNDLRQLSLEYAQTAVLAYIVYQAVTDPHMQRRCERLLYDWATKSDLHEVVVKVSCRMLSTGRRDIAFTRLRRVVDSGKASVQTCQDVLEVFRLSLEDPSQREFLSARAQANFREESTANSSRLLFMALMQSDVDGVPWLATPAAKTSASDRMLGAILSNLNNPAATEALGVLLRKSGGSGEFYESVVQRVASGVFSNGALLEFFNFKAGLENASEGLDSDPLNDIALRINALCNSQIEATSELPAS